MNEPSDGTIVRIAGPVIVAQGLPTASMYDVVYAGNLRLVGEVIRLSEDLATIQVYEDTGGLCVGEPVVCSGGPFTVELGPGMLGSVYDGVQRPLPTLYQQLGDYIARGQVAPALDREKRWDFEPRAQVGATLSGGDAAVMARLRLVLAQGPRRPTRRRQEGRGHAHALRRRR